MNKPVQYALYGFAAVALCGLAYSLAQPAQSAEMTPKPQETSTSATATATAPEKNESDEIDMNKMSEAFGNFIGRNLKSPGFKFDLDNIIKGLREGAAGKPSPMTDQEYEKSMMKLQEKAIKQVTAENLKEANEFLINNLKNPNVVELEPGKLQYMILEQGTGPEVKEHDRPQISYTGSYADGTEFGSSAKAGGPITVPLDQTIRGFSKGIVGMKEGEKRRLFIHPDLGYGTAGNLPPNKLLIFDVQVIKANNAPDKKTAAMLSEDEDLLEQSIGDEDADPTAEYSEIADDNNKSSTEEGGGEVNINKAPETPPATK